jgi:hypothetical protein
MSREIIGGALLAAGVWAIFAAGMTGLAPISPRGHAWVVTASEKMSDRPQLVRAALPMSPRAVLAAVQ